MVMGSGWRHVDTPLYGPLAPAREGAGMAYDAALHRVILFGGQVNENVYFNDTWELTSTATPTPTPSPTPTQAPQLHLRHAREMFADAKARPTPAPRP